MKFIFLLIFSISLFAQQTTIDTLLNKTKNLPDSSKAKYLNDFAWNNRSKNPHLALESAQQAYKIAEAINDLKLQANALNYIGVIYRNLGSYDLAISTYTNALKIAEEAGDSVQISYSMNNIGGIYRLEGNNKIALEYILKALKYFERVGNKQGISYCTINIGLIYRRQLEFAKALEYLNYTMKIRKEIKDKPGAALALNLIAEVYMDLGNVDKALVNYFQVEKQYQEIDDKKGLAATWGGIGGVYFLKKDYKRSLNYRLRALDMSVKIDYLEGQVTNHNNLGRIYCKLGQFAKADEHYLKAFKIASGMKEVYGKLECYKFLAEHYELKGELKKALSFNKEYYMLKDSLTRKDNIAMIYQYEANQINLKNENEKALLQKENENQNKRAIYLLGLITVVLLFSFILYRKAQKTKALNVKLSQLNALKDKFFGIIAHDLRNPFNVLLGYSEILEKDFHKMEDNEKIEIIREISGASKGNYALLENLLSWANSQTGVVPFNPQNMALSKAVSETVSLFKVTAKNKEVLLEENIDGSITVNADVDMLRSILRNLISNAIKFSHTGGKISVDAKKEESFVTVSVEDNGVGIPDDKVKKLFHMDKISTTEGTAGETGTGLGLILCQEFVEKNGGKIWIESQQGKGSRFCFTLPAA